MIGLIGACVTLSAHPHDTLPIAVADIAAGGISDGPHDAPVLIVEFSDFGCVHCKALQPTIKRIKEHYAGKVRFLFRHFPLSDQTWVAAEAALCAGEQGGYWPMHEALFAAPDLSIGRPLPDLAKLARGLNLDVADFRQCLVSNRQHDTVQADVWDGIDANVSGTPTLFVNDQPVVGAVPFDTLAAYIDAELATQ